MLARTTLLCSLEAEPAVELLSQRGLLHDVGHGAGYQGEGRAEWPPGRAQGTTPVSPNQAGARASEGGTKRCRNNGDSLTRATISGQ